MVRLEDDPVFPLQVFEVLGLLPGLVVDDFARHVVQLRTPGRFVRRSDPVLSKICLDCTSGGSTGSGATTDRTTSYLYGSPQRSTNNRLDGTPSLGKVGNKEGIIRGTDAPKRGIWGFGETGGTRGIGGAW